MLVLSFDTETTGLPVYKERSHHESQPHIVQIGAVLFDTETGLVVDQFEAIVRPDGWVIPHETIEVHGITNERAAAEGIPEIDALVGFLELYDRCSLRVAHGTTFDNRIIRIAFKRYLPDLIPDEVWKDKAGYFCTLSKSRKIMGGNSGHKLEQAYEHFTGKHMVNAHKALPDALACMEIYLAVKDK